MGKGSYQHTLPNLRSPKEGRVQTEGAFSYLKLLWQWHCIWIVGHCCSDSEVGSSWLKSMLFRIVWVTVVFVTSLQCQPIGRPRELPQNIQKKKNVGVLYVHVYLPCFIPWMLLSGSDPYLVLPHHEALIQWAFWLECNYWQWLFCFHRWQKTTLNMDFSSASWW
jgi:hypothetical protein